MRRYRMKKGFLFLAFAALMLFGGSFVVMLLWNALLPAIFGLPALSIWQAVGLLVLSRILMGGFRRPWSARRHYWRKQMAEKWAGMTPEEREQWKQQWRGRCGNGWRHEDKPETSDLV